MDGNPTFDSQTCKNALANARALTLDQHLLRVDVFKLGLRNSLGIDFRSASHPVLGDDQEVTSRRFHYLAEVFPFIAPRVNALDAQRRRAYETLKEEALESFWQIYADFQPLLRSVSTNAGIDVSRIEPILARAILLFDASRRTKFVTYLEKTFRESVKNLRGQEYAQQLGLPLSAGRLVPQMTWELEQASMRSGHMLSPEESDAVVIDFLTRHPAKFSSRSMQSIAEVMRRERHRVSLDHCRDWLEPSAPSGAGAPGPGNDCYVEQHEECQSQLRQIHEAIGRAGLDADENTIVLHRLDLPHDQRRLERIARTVTSASLRKRAGRLLVRLMAARYCNQAPRFGVLLKATPSAARNRIRQLIDQCASERSSKASQLINETLNWMSLSDSVYKISISERGKLAGYLSQTPRSPISSAVFQKLKAALIEQERLDFPCWSNHDSPLPARRTSE